MSVPDEAVVEPLQHDPLTGRQVMVAAVVVLAVTVLLVKLGKRTLRWDIRQYYAINKHHWCYTGLFTQVKNILCSYYKLFKKLLINFLDKLVDFYVLYSVQEMSCVLFYLLAMFFFKLWSLNTLTIFIIF